MKVHQRCERCGMKSYITSMNANALVAHCMLSDHMWIPPGDPVGDAEAERSGQAAGERALKALLADMSTKLKDD